MRTAEVVVAIVTLLMTPCLATAQSDEQAAREILQRSGVQGGLVVHIGCGEGTLTAALRAGEAWLERVENAR
jgi:hypothetical protein